MTTYFLFKQKDTLALGHRQSEERFLLCLPIKNPEFSELYQECASSLIKDDAPLAKEPESNVKT